MKVGIAGREVYPSAPPVVGADVRRPARVGAVGLARGADSGHRGGGDGGDGGQP